MDYSFGTWIKRRRKALDLTQHQLAQRVGCSVSLIFKIESDERRPSRQIAELLAKHLEIPAEEQPLFLKVARQEKAADSLPSLTSPSPLPTTSQTPPDLPLPLTSLVGREPEIHLVVQQIQSPDCRLLTLTGPGGVGKTRLALEVAHRLRDTFDDGAYFVSLVGTNAAEFMIPAIASTVGLPFSGKTELKTQLFSFLSEKQTLLVLDNLEHLLDGIEFLDLLLQAAPGLKLVATSREQLNLRTEWVFEIQGLPIPMKIEPGELEANSAVALFVQRARQVKASFMPSAEDGSAIAKIAWLVEGLPLGLELAATWINALSCREIAIEIERSLDFLSTSQRDLPERHRSMQAVFQYSWNLLSAEEQSVVKALSVFRGGFQREAAEQVSGARVSVLSSLLGKSLLRRSESGRYSQHELVRQYAALQLYEDPQQEKSARDHHARYYLSFWAEHETQLHGSQQYEISKQLTDEIDNFRAAWDWAVEQEQVQLIAQCLRALLAVYDLHGWYAEGIQRAESVLHLLPAAQESWQSHAYHAGYSCAVKGWFLFRRGQLHEAHEAFAQGIEILRPLHVLPVLADVLSMFGPVLTSLGEREKSIETIKAGLNAARTTGDPSRVAYALMMQGGILAGSGNLEEAYKSSQEALGLLRRLGDTRLIVVTLNTLGFVTMQLGRYSEAREHLRQSLETITPAEDPWSAGTAYGNLGFVELAQGNAGEAQTLLQKSISLFMDMGMLGDVALYRTYLGDAFAAQGAMKDAEENWRDAVHMASETRALPTVLAGLVRLAQAEADRGEAARAYEWAIQVANHPASWQESKARAEKLYTELRAKYSTQQLESTDLPASKKFPDLLVQEILARQSSETDRA